MKLHRLYDEDRKPGEPREWMFESKWVSIWRVRLKHPKDAKRYRMSHAFTVGTKQRMFHVGVGYWPNKDPDRIVWWVWGPFQLTRLGDPRVLNVGRLSIQYEVKRWESKFSSPLVS